MEVGGSKRMEYIHSIERFEQIYKEQGLMFAFYFLYDSGYNKEDIGAMAIMLKEAGKKNG